MALALVFKSSAWRQVEEHERKTEHHHGWIIRGCSIRKAHESVKLNPKSLIIKKLLYFPSSFSFVQDAVHSKQWYKS